MERDVPQTDESEYECLECGATYEADSYPCECEECGTLLRNRHTPME